MIYQKQQHMLSNGAPMALVEKVDQTVDSGQQTPMPISNPPNRSNAPWQVLPGSGAKPMSRVNYFHEKQLVGRLSQQQHMLNNGAPMALVEKVLDQTMNNGRQIPIPISNPPNGSNAPSQILLGTKSRSPVNYVHHKQLLQRLLPQQQRRRLMNGVPMAPKVEKVDQTVDNGQQTLITISNPPKMSNAQLQVLSGSGAKPVSLVNYVHQKHLQRLLQQQQQQQMLTSSAPMALVRLR